MSIRLCTAVLALFSAAAMGDSAGVRDSLYARLGGSPTVAAFVDASLERAALSPAERALARETLIARICALSGGGCSITAGSHDAPFTIEELRRAMRAQDVPLTARNELLDLLARR